MSTLDEVIARSRAPGAFSEHKRFTVARAAAVRKMRQFSLVSPYFYVLELVQSAIANGATYIDLSIEQSFVGMSFVGGGYTAQELGSLFDFLFASKADIDTADLRQLALGLNVLMLTEPELIVVESGDGTLEGTTRIDIRPRQDTVDVGKPEQALKGTFVSVKGIKRKLLKKFESSAYSYMAFPELAVLSERCLCTPVPLIINNEALHGYGAMRAPVLYGYSRVLSFDEGDLYGTITLFDAPPSGKKGRQSVPAPVMESLKLLTWGVWVQSVEEEIFPGVRLGGVVNFNRLTKTADHSAIVRDIRYEELWARLKPWARQLQSGKKGAQGAYNIRPLDDAPLTPRELRVLLSGVSHVVSVPEIDPQSQQAAWARRIGESLDAPVLMCGDGDGALLQALGGQHLNVITPDLRSPDDALFFSQPVLQPPEGAWAAAPLDAAPLPALEVAREVSRALGEPLEVGCAALGAELSEVAEGGATPEGDEVQVQIYTPLDGAQIDGARVQLVSAQRLLWEGVLPSSFAGLLVRAALPLAAPRAARLIGPTIAQAILALRIDALEQAARRALDGLSFHVVEPGTLAAELALAAMARDAVWRLERVDDATHVALELIGASQEQLLDIPVLRALDGQPRTMREVTTRLKRGLIYGVCEGVEAALDGLDTGDILALNPVEEALLARCVGEACYVRVDGRDVLSAAQDAQLRDVAVGLREYPAGASLLVEGAFDASLEDALIGGLLKEHTRALPETPEPVELERRRQLLRHMQWCAVRSLLNGAPRLERVGLFADQDGFMRTLTELVAAADRYGAVLMNGGVAQDMWLSNPPRGTPAELPCLTMNPFALSLLQEIVSVRPSLQLPAARGDGAQDVLVSEAVDTGEVRGKLYLTLEPPKTPIIGIYSPDRRRVELYARRWTLLGVVGELTRVTSSATFESELDAAAARLFERLADMVEAQQLSGAARERALELLFGYVSAHLRLVRLMSGVAPVVGSGLAQRVLAMPLFDAAHGRPVSGMRLLEDFCKAQLRAEAPRGIELAAELPAPLGRWRAQTLVPERIQHNKPATPRVAPSDVARLGPQVVRSRIEHTLNRWLAQLNPASWALPTVRLVGMPGGEEPDELSEARERMWMEMMSEGALFKLRGGDQHSFLYVRADAEELWALIKACLTDQRALAWLLLAIYGTINHIFEPITNEHELELHQRVAGALLREELIEL